MFEQYGSQAKTLSRLMYIFLGMICLLISTIVYILWWWLHG